MTNDYIRSLCGLTEAELSDDILDNSKIIPKVKLLRQRFFETVVELDEDNPTTEAFTQLDYMAYKAISLLRRAILIAMPKTMKDNFNSFTRFDSIEGLFEHADNFVAQIENPDTGTADYELLTVVPAAVDPVTQG